MVEFFHLGKWFGGNKDKCYTKGCHLKFITQLFDTVHKKYVTNKYGHAKIESSHLNTEIWTMTCDWETLLKKRKKCKAFTYWTGNP